MTTCYLYNAQTKQLIAAPNPITLDGHVVVNPSIPQNARIGAYPLGTSTPEPPEGKVAVKDGYELVDGHWCPTWRYEDAPAPAPRRWTKLTIEDALADRLDEVDAFLGSVIIKGKLTAARAFSRCDYIEEGYGGAETWNALLNGAATALGKTREEVDAFLDALPTE